MQDPTPLIKAAFNSVTKDKCCGWIKNAGYLKNSYGIFPSRLFMTVSKAVNNNMTIRQKQINHARVHMSC